MVSVPDAETVCADGSPEPADGEALMATLVVLVVSHCNLVTLPSPIVLGFAVKLAVGTAFVLMLMSRVITSGPLHPARVAVRVNVVGLLTVKLRVPPEGLTP